MDPPFKAVVLAVKHMNHYILKQYDTLESNRYQKLEKILQRSYSRRTHSKDKFQVGSYVATQVSLGAENRPKLWLRGVIRENYHQKDFLYGIHFPDYGFDKTCHRSDLNELLDYHYPELVPFQEFDFYLTDVDNKPDIIRDNVLQEIRNQFEANNFIVLVTPEGRDRKGSIYGSIQVGEDCDLAAILLEKELVIDVHFCGRYYDKRKASTQMNIKENQPIVGPLPIGPFRSGTKACRVNSRSYDLICKCDAVIKYKRKLLRDKLKVTTKNWEKKSEDKSISDAFLNTL